MISEKIVRLIDLGYEKLPDLWIEEDSELRSSENSG